MRAYYADPIERFLVRTPEEILGALADQSQFTLEPTQRDAWRGQIEILQDALLAYAGRGKLFFEYAVPRLGTRIDVLLLIDHVIFVLEFKVGETRYNPSAIDQVCDYGLDLKNFHETSHDKNIAPILVATHATPQVITPSATPHRDGLLDVLCISGQQISATIELVLRFCDGSPIDVAAWEAGRYCPTPTIIEAAIALYGGHHVTDISRSDAGATNLTCTSEAVSQIIATARANSQKAICFVTGVPGAGKTLVGLNIAVQHMDKSSELYSVFLSGNGPLVTILREALARDRVQQEAKEGKLLRKGEARSVVKAFIQNVHHFRDDCLKEPNHPPIEHVALFDEAQRAWDLEHTADFMLRKKKRPDFRQSEPEFLISCLDRHPDWAVVVCLVGGGQEINTGEAGISEWIRALNSSFPDWRIHISPRLHDSEYGAGSVLKELTGRDGVQFNEDLHLGVSMRSFRAENVSALVKNLLDRNVPEVRRILAAMGERYPLVITRDLQKAKNWLRHKARGSERYGMIVSSQAERLKPHAIDVRSPMNPVHWFLSGKEDVRSSYYLEHVATEFDIQGLELDWACVVWDGDFRYAQDEWRHFSFVGRRWKHVRKAARQTYLKNAYRVLLTRARQGMVIVVPPGTAEDPTRHPDFYDPTFAYLQGLGLPTI